MFSHPQLIGRDEIVNGRDRTDVQFAQHDEMRLVRVYRPAFVHQLEHRLGRVQKDKALADDMEVGDTTCAKKNQHGRVSREHDEPYSFAQLSAKSQSSFALRSATLPRTGSGFGPGGSGAGGFG